LSDFGGRSLSVLNSSLIQINPDHPQAHTLRGWFDQGGAENVQDLSNQNGSQGLAGKGMSTQANWKTLEQLRDEKLGMNDKADYFSANGLVLYAKKDNALYMACPGENCNKKVVDQNDGFYRCEKCCKNYNNFKWRIILSVNKI
jgi:replication factor A1